MEKVFHHTKRTVIGILGGIVVLLGVVMIPYPGPGWLVVFAGLAILATEFDWAQRVLDYAKGIYESWQKWLKRQSRIVQALFFALTSVVVLITIWLLNGYGLINAWLNLGQPWLASPIFS